MNFDEALEDLEFLDDDLERLEYLIDLAIHLPPFPGEFRTEDNLVRGCSSKAWMVGSFSGSDPPRLSLMMDADAHIVRGLVTLLWLAFNDKTAEEIRSTDVVELLGRLRLADQLTPGRQNGLHAMLERIKALAAAALPGEDPSG